MLKWKLLSDTYVTVTANDYTRMTLVKECGMEERKEKKTVVAGLTPLNLFRLVDTVEVDTVKIPASLLRFPRKLKRHDGEVESVKSVCTVFQFSFSSLMTKK